MAVNGTVLDVPEDGSKRQSVWLPSFSTRYSIAAFPKVRLVLLIEAGTHLIANALMCPYRMGERARVKKLPQLT